ncbi:MAG: cytochrome c peroxidase [Myxococcota bacterium]
MTPALRKTEAVLVALLSVLSVGCGDANTVAEGGAGGGAGVVPVLPWPLEEFPALPSEAVDVPEERIELGRLLFSDPVLSIDDQTACVTCHSEFWGMSDALAVGIGHDAGLVAGPDREGPNISRRNSLALFNLAFRETLLWDGRATTLEEQAIMPLLAREEMNIDPEVAVERLARIPEYVERFAVAFPEDPTVTVDHLASALAAFERTLVSDRSLYDTYVAGAVEVFDDELIDGMFRFAEMGCDGCHTPPLFESETFHDRNVPGSDDANDPGRAEETERFEDIGKFRTPTLRNAFVTEPYFHNGAVNGLRDAVEHELSQSGLEYDEEDVRLILAFVDRALRDTSRALQRPRSVPSGLPLPLDRER